MKTPTDLFRDWTTERMRERGLTHAQLAVRCDVDRSTVTRILRGERRPTLDVAVRIIAVLDDGALPPPLERAWEITGSPSGEAKA